jgi:hypothetical protein
MVHIGSIKLQHQMSSQFNLQYAFFGEIQCQFVMLKHLLTPSLTHIVIQYFSLKQKVICHL